MDSLHLITENARRLREMHALIHSTYATRKTSPEAWQDWLTAYADFHKNYDALAFPRGQNSAKSRERRGTS